MSLQFADFNADGHLDIVTATWEGTPFLVPGSAEGWQTPHHITDAEGRKMYLSRYYDFDNNKYDNWKYGEGDETIQGDHLISTLAWDWDEDGDFDLLFGAKDGQLYLRENHGSAKEPKFASTNKKVRAGDGDFRVKGGMTAAKRVDWDGDGRHDLICGSFEGGAYLYRNTGKAGAPSFAKAVQLIGASKSADGSKGPETGWYVDATDYDGDGDLDLLVGGYYMRIPPQRELTADETARLATVSKTLQAKNKELMQHYDAVRKNPDLSDEERNAAYKVMREKPAYQALMKELTALRKEQNLLKPTPSRTSGIWVFRQETASGDAPGEKPGEKVVRR